MKNLTKVSFITACSFLLILFYVYSPAKTIKTGDSPAVSLNAAVKGSQETPFPTQSVPGLYVNKSPAFSVSYPDNWVEKPLDEAGCVLEVSTSEGFPRLKIFILQTTGTPLKDATDVYSQVLWDSHFDTKLLYDRKTQRSDGYPSREAEFEFTFSKIRGKNLYVTTKKGAEWVVAVITVIGKGEIDESLKTIARSLKFKPEGPASGGVDVTDKKAKTPYRYKIPEQTDDGWPTADASEVKLNKEKINDLADEILDGTYRDIHSILVIKNDKLVFEEYFPIRLTRGVSVVYSRDHLHYVASVTKSFSSTLIGIAIDKGLIKGTEESLLSFFPEYKKELNKDNKGAITLEEVLTMSAGFDWNEVSTSYISPENSYVAMTRADDIIGYLFNRPIKDPPGINFNYNTGLSTLLGVMIERRSSLSINEFAQKYLFGPLGITKYEWKHLDKAHKVPASGSGLALRPRDMAKLGYLFLQKGNWKGEQIVSAEWVEEATCDKIDFTLYFPSKSLTGYGYQWWRTKFKTKDMTIEGYTAWGLGGQFIFVFPTLDAVIVFTSKILSSGGLLPLSLMSAYILPAMTNPE